MKVVVIRYLGKRKIGTEMTKITEIERGVVTAREGERDQDLAHSRHLSSLEYQKRPKVVIARA